MEKAKHIADMRFCFSDYREDKFNESVDCTFAIWDDPSNCIAMDIELYWCLCRQFAAAMGFDDKTIIEWFGDC